MEFLKQTLFVQTPSNVTGDGVPDKVSLYGNKPESSTEIFTDNITVVI